MRHQRGSALILTLLLAIAATTAVLTMANLTSQNSKQESNREYQVKARYGIEGALARVEQSFNDGTLSLGSNTPYTIGGVTWTANTIDNSATLAKSYKVTVSGRVGGKDYARTFVIGNPYERGPFHFALYSAKKIDAQKELTVGSSPAGSVASGGDIDTHNLVCGVGGNVELEGSLKNSGSLTVSGTTKVVAAIPAEGTVTTTNYTAAANRILVTGTLAGITFAASPELYSRTGALTISGVVRNKGTIFVNGDVTIGADVTYFDSNAALSVIATGKISVLGTVLNVSGLYWAGNDITISSGATTLNAPKTVLATTGNMTFHRPLNITYDDRVLKSQQLGYDLKLPRYWP
ncbi:MAG: hypothetical protein HZC36_02175 [Armatimonadetes bacterium]|nr:hypothetical protein [Armatimonadota bacterium]